MISQSLNTFSNFRNYPLQIQLRRRTREDKNLVRGEGNLLPSKKIKPPIRPGVFLCYKVNKVMADLDEFILTRKEIGKLLGISPNAVRMRARNGNQDNLEYRNIGGKILYKRPRANQDIRPPGRWYGKQKEMASDPRSVSNSKSSKDWKDWKKVRRGVTHIGEGNYPNEAMKYHNEMKILARIQKEVPEHVVKKLPQGIRQAEKLTRELEQNPGKNFPEPKYYGGMLHQAGRRYHKSMTETKEMFYPKANSNSFFIQGNGKPNPSRRFTGYDIGNTYDDNVEVSPKQSYEEPTRFKNKIEESIYRARKVLKKNPY